MDYSFNIKAFDLRFRSRVWIKVYILEPWIRVLVIGLWIRVLISKHLI